MGRWVTLHAKTMRGITQRARRARGDLFAAMVQKRAASRWFFFFFSFFSLSREQRTRATTNTYTLYTLSVREDVYYALAWPRTAGTRTLGNTCANRASLDALQWSFHLTGMSGWMAWVSGFFRTFGSPSGVKLRRSSRVQEKSRCERFLFWRCLGLFERKFFFVCLLKRYFCLNNFNCVRKKWILIKKLI